MKTQIDINIVATMTLAEAQKTLDKLVPSDALFGPLSDAVDMARTFRNKYPTTFTG